MPANISIWNKNVDLLPLLAFRNRSNDLYVTWSCCPGSSFSQIRATLLGAWWTCRSKQLTENEGDADHYRLSHLQATFLYHFLPSLTDGWQQQQQQQYLEGQKISFSLSLSGAWNAVSQAAGILGNIIFQGAPSSNWCLGKLHFPVALVTAVTLFQKSEGKGFQEA